MSKPLNSVVAFFLISTITYGQYVWTERDSVHGQAKSSSVGFSIGNGGFIMTGFDGTEYKRSLYQYNIFIDDWDRMESLGGINGAGLERSNAACFVVENIAYVGTGQGNSPFFQDLWAYDPLLNAWTQKANFSGTPRRSAVGFAINSKGYIGTGYDNTFSFKKDMWEYTPATNSWWAVASFGGASRAEAVAFVVDSIAYVGTGEGQSPYLGDFWKFDPTSNNWSPITSFQGTPRHGAAAFTINDKGFVATGYDNNFEYKNDFWEYDPVQDQWTMLPDFIGTPRSNATGFSIGNSGFLGTGFDGSPRGDFFEYGPPVGIDEANENLFSSTVFPNPTSDRISFFFSSHEKPNVIKLYDLAGNEVRSIVTHGLSTVSANLSHLASGTYYYHAMFPNESKSAIGKISVMH